VTTEISIFFDRKYCTIFCSKYNFKKYLSKKSLFSFSFKKKKKKNFCKKKKKKKKKFPKYGSELSATPTKSAGQARGGLTTPEAFFMWKDSMECLKTLLENDLSENSQKLNRQGEREG
jgi:hypothetical protein